MSQSERKPGHSVVEAMITIIGIVVLIGLAVPAHRGLGVRATVAECVQAANAAGPSATALLDSLAALPQCSAVRQTGERSVSVTVHDDRAQVAPVLQLVLAEEARPGPPWRCSQLAGDPRHMPLECRAAAARPDSDSMSHHAPPGLQQALR